MLTNWPPLPPSPLSPALLKPLIPSLPSVAFIAHVFAIPLSLKAASLPCHSPPHPFLRLLIFVDTPDLTQKYRSSELGSPWERIGAVYLSGLLSVILQFHPFSSAFYNFISLYIWLRFHCVSMPTFIVHSSVDRCLGCLHSAKDMDTHISLWGGLWYLLSRTWICTHLCGVWYLLYEFSNDIAQS